MSQPPSVGRIVHYVSYGTPGREYRSECRAAIITAVQPDGEQYADGTPLTRADLAVLNPEGMFFNRAYEHSEDIHHGGTWHWPERGE